MCLIPTTTISIIFQCGEGNIDPFDILRYPLSALNSSYLATAQESAETLTELMKGGISHFPANYASR